VVGVAAVGRDGGGCREAEDDWKFMVGDALVVGAVVFGDALVVGAVVFGGAAFRRRQADFF